MAITLRLTIKSHLEKEMTNTCTKSRIRYPLCVPYHMPRCLFVVSRPQLYPSNAQSRGTVHERWTLNPASMPAARPNAIQRAEVCLWEEEAGEEGGAQRPGTPHGEALRRR